MEFDGIGVMREILKTVLTPSYFATPVSLLWAVSPSIPSSVSRWAILIDENSDLKVDKIVDGEYVGHVESDGQQGPEFSGTWEAWQQPE